MLAAWLRLDRMLFDRRIRIFSSPFLFADEGLSFGGFCPGFDVAGSCLPVAKGDSRAAALTRTPYGSKLRSRSRSQQRERGGEAEPKETSLPEPARL